MRSRCFQPNFKILKGDTSLRELPLHFESVTGCTTSTCGYFSHPSDSTYGASPDAICPGPILLEIKTRAENSTSPLINLKGEHLLQIHLQMVCTGFSYVIIESFHPETETAIFSQ